METKGMRLTQETHDLLWDIKRRNRLASLEAAILSILDKNEHLEKVNTHLRERANNNFEL